MSDDFEEYDPDDWETEEDEFESFDCHMTLDPKTKKPLGCGMAGTEQCEFECPYRGDLMWRPP
jgi:hypothetical protein